MNRIFMVAAVFITLVMPSVSHAQKLTNVFSKPGVSQSQTRSSSAPDLGGMLQSGGFKFEMHDQTSYSVTAVHDGREIPVSVYLNNDKTMVWVRVNLTQLPEDSSQHLDKVLNLLELSGTYGHAFYSYDSESRMIQIYSMIEPNKIDATELGRRIKTISAQAVDQADAWLADQWTSERHVGSWTAQMSDNARMTIDLRGDGSFKLINKASGQVINIAGKYKIEQGKLMMRDNEGNEIAGEILFIDGNHFTLNVNNEDLEFERG